MLSRIAACAAVVLVWPVCTQAADGEGALLVSEIVAAIDQPRTGAAQDIPATENQSLPLENVTAAALSDQLKAADPNPPIDSKSVIPAPAEPFGLDAEPVRAGAILAKWGGVEAQIKTEDRILARCRAGGPWCPWAARHFLTIVNDGRMRSGRARIGVINREINFSIVPTSDLAQWGVADRWSSPLETFTTQRGDCEDYAIAKFVALRAAGIARQDVRLVIVHNHAAGEQHAVVAVRLDGDWVILDNRWLALVRDREMWRATPLFELDDSGVRRFLDRAPTSRIVEAAATSDHFVSASYTPAQSGPGGSAR
jgi:predicted transglutaminase-like cysteine proteinase